MTDILLISPPSRMDNHYRPPLSLMYVASYYREKGHSVKIADFPFSEYVRNAKFWRDRKEMVSESKVRILDEVRRHNYKLIGVSCYSTEYDEVKDLIQKIKKISTAKIVVGGPHPTLRPEDFNGLADEVVRGRRDAGYSCYDLVDMGHYLTPNPYAIRGILLNCAYVVSGFGCPSQCTFCVAPALREYFKGESKTPQSLYEEILLLKKNYKIDAFYIIDDLYTLNKNRVKEFCSLIGKTKLLWGCNSRINTLDEETIKLMSKSGCIQLDFGVERGSDEALKIIQKGITVKQIKETFKLCKKYHIRTFANFLVNIPDETIKDWEDIELLIKEIKPTITCINVYQHYLGCKMEATEPSKELMAWTRKSMVKYNWTSGFKFSAFRYFRLKYYKSFVLLFKEVINQLFSR